MSNRFDARVIPEDGSADAFTVTGECDRGVVTVHAVEIHRGDWHGMVADHRLAGWLSDHVEDLDRAVWALGARSYSSPYAAGPRPTLQVP